MSAPHPFWGRRAVIATKHGKERVIDPLLRSWLHLFGEVLPLDTDVFGTFTGEIARTGSQREALRAKLRAAAEVTPYDAVFVASEGSFFPDPAFPLATVGRELVALYDRERDLEIIGVCVTSETNAGTFDVSDDGEIDHALSAIGFPSHAVVLRAGEALEKGVWSRTRINEFARLARRNGSKLRIESDMRAHVNPTRMAAIESAAYDAVERSLSRCPACTRPGFWWDEAVPGLPCAACDEPTELMRERIRRCAGCGFSAAQLQHGRADPSHCGVCNP